MTPVRDWHWLQKRKMVGHIRYAVAETARTKVTQSKVTQSKTTRFKVTQAKVTESRVIRT